MRIVSLLPTGTQMLYALGLGGQVAGVTHECDDPPEARGKPQVVRPIFDPAAHSPAEIDRLVSEAARRGESIYRLDLDLLCRIDPDLIVTQDLCDVCAVSTGELVQVAAALPRPPRVVKCRAHTVEDVLRDIERLGRAAGAAAAAADLTAGYRRRIAAVQQAVAGKPRVRALCLEWLDPLYGAGHWIPQLVEWAGGHDGLAAASSQRIGWGAVRRYAPEVVVLMPCGYDVQRTLAELPLLTQLPGWDDLPAVRQGRVYATHAQRYFSGGGPRLIDGLEMLAAIFHPDRFPLEVPLEACRRVL